MKRKGIVIVAVCLILVGLLSVNGTLANTVNRIFRIINGKDQPEQNEQMLQVKLINETFAADGSGLTEMNGMPNITPAYYPDKFDWDNDKDDVIIDGQAYALWNETLRSPVSKVVSVQNMAVEEGAKDAYFRVAIAVDANIFHLLKINFNKAEDSHYIWADKWMDITVDGRAYKMMVATYTEALEPGEKSPPFMLQVAMDKTATNEDYAKIDNHFMRITAMAVDADTLTDANDLDAKGPSAERPSAVETLNATVPVDENLNPF
ncbi:MAG: hypothetical protein IJO67_09360, partial [Clostridia bacterium]|nr:hypothetical protein [Clostridia bacterium]